ncbi:hypothetical protein RFI_24804, partial [Reticulomyxa filosa]
MASTTETAKEPELNIEKLVKQMKGQASQNNHRAVIRSCNKLLSTLLKDKEKEAKKSEEKKGEDLVLEVVRNKCIAQLHLNLNVECEKSIVSELKDWKHHLVLYHCYSLYKQNKNREAMEIFADVKNTHSLQTKQLSSNEKEGLDHLHYQF